MTAIYVCAHQGGQPTYHDTEQAAESKARATGGSEDNREGRRVPHGDPGGSRMTHTYNVTRFACRCGRFLAMSAIREEDYRDPTAYYGVSTRVEWDCSRCGTVQGEGTWEPPLVVVGTRTVEDCS